MDVLSIIRHLLLRRLRCSFFLVWIGGFFIFYPVQLTPAPPPGVFKLLIQGLDLCDGFLFGGEGLEVTIPV